MEEIKLEEVMEETADKEAVPEETAEPTEREKLLEDKLFCIQSGVPEENCDVVIAAAAAMGNPDRKAAITEVLERYPFFKPTRSDRAEVTTGVHIEGIESAPVSGVEEAFFAANPDCR